MGFRDDGEAARARADALERENQQLRAKVAALEGRRDGDATTTTEEEPHEGGGRRSPLLLLLALMLGLGSGVAALAGVGEGALIGLVVASLLGSAWLISGLLLIVGPNEVLVLSGRKTRLADGRWRGYRTVRAGRVLRTPLIETAEWLSLQTICLSPRVEQAFTRDNTTVTVELSATVRIGADEPLLGFAVERFLGQPRARIADVARETIEGALRTAVADHSLAALKEPGFEYSSAFDEAEHDLATLGLVLDTLKLRRVDESDRNAD
jgi:uncharacterized membrane protein YqiK